jgi:hypothetical protein
MIAIIPGKPARRHFRRTGALLQTAASTRDGIAGYEMTSNIEYPSTSPGSAEGNRRVANVARCRGLARTQQACKTFPLRHTPRPVDLQNSDSAAHTCCRIFPIYSIGIPALKPAAFCQASALVEISPPRARCVANDCIICSKLP